LIDLMRGRFKESDLIQIQDSEESAIGQVRKESQ
jgi:hypothetical protein